MKKYAYILIGVPASGKSTWATDFVKLYGSSVHYCSSDHLIETYADYQGTTYDAVFHELIDIANDYFFKSVEWGVKNGKHLIIDRTNLSPRKRRELRNFITDLDPGYEFIYKVFNPPLNDWANRLFSREGKSIPASVLVSMLQNIGNYSEDESEYVERANEIAV